MPSNNIKELLNKHRSNTAYWSHVSLVTPKGKFSFHRDSYDNFMEEYCNTLNTKTKVGIAEKPENYIPILVDVDLKSNTKEELYNEDTIKNVIQIYQQVLKEIIDDKKKLLETDAVVLEKEGYKSGNVYKNGFHLHFPKIFISKDNHKNVLLPRVKNLIKEKEIFGNKNIDEIIDDCYIKNAWLLYGSSKEDSSPYKLTKIYNDKMEKIDINKAFINYKIYDTESNQIELNGDIYEYLPYILSIRLQDRNEYVYEVKKTMNNFIPNIEKSRKRVRNKQLKHLQLTQGDYILVKKLLFSLKQERVEEHNLWHQIGLILYNIFHGEEKGLDLWLEWSRNIKENHSQRGTPDNFNDSACIDTWRRMVSKGISIGTLKFLSKKDNPKEYNKIIKEHIKNYVQKVCDVGASHFDIATLLYEKYGHEFVCCSYSKKIWYRFEKHIWNKNDDGVDLRKKISKDVARIFEQQIQDLKKDRQELSTINQTSDDGFDEYSESESESESEEELDISNQQNSHRKDITKIEAINKKIEKLYKLINQCRQNPFKNSVMKECMELFYDPKFKQNLNNNKYLFAFKNGVYDLKTDTFRDGEPNDYLTIKAGVNYKSFNETDEEIINIIDFFEKIFPDKSVRDYFIKTSSEVFVGGNHRKHVYVWQGYGHNGKTVTQNLFEKMLGDYSIKLPTSLIVGKRTASGSACPELARAGNGVRWAIAQEPEQKDIINTGILKELSGNDTFFARALFDDGGEMTPMFKLGLICNKLPQIPNSDQATWNRIRIIPFESTFTDNAPTDPNEQLKTKIFPVDRDFEDKKLPGMLEGLAWYLLNYRHKNKLKSLIEPEKVTAATAAYQRKSDIYRQYIEEQIIEHEQSTVSLRQVYEDFKDWFKNSMPGQTTPIKNDVKEYFMNHWGDPLPGIKWKGFRIRLLVEED